MENRGKITVRVEKRVAHIVLDNPPENRMDMLFFRQLDEAIKGIQQRNDIGAAVLYGSKRHFSSGAELEDIKHSLIMPLQAGIDKECEVKKESLKNARIFMDIEALPFPVIAAVCGCCIGSGMELAMASDMIFCGRDAIFSQPEITWGLITGCSGSIRLKNLVNSAKAGEFLLRGTLINGQEAYESGLANRVYDRGKVVPAAIELAEHLAVPSRYNWNAEIKREILNMVYA